MSLPRELESLVDLGDSGQTAFRGVLDDASLHPIEGPLTIDLAPHGTTLIVVEGAEAR